MKIKIKKLHENAIIPIYSYFGDAGIDLIAISKNYDEFGNVSYGIGLAIEIPEGYVGLIFPRSSNCKKDLLLTNSVGVIDSNFRGEIFVKFKPSLIFASNEFSKTNEIGNISKTFDKIDIPGNPYSYEEYEIGDRICQLIIIPYPKIEFQEVEELSETQRGEGGFGHTGII